MLIRFKRSDGTEYPQWKEKKLGSISEIYQPQTISQSECTGGEYPVYGANGLIGYYHKYNHDKEQIAICCRGASCGKVNLVPEKSWITGNAMVINVDKSNINKKYLYELLSFQNLNYMVCGSGQPQITREPCISHKVYVPSLEEQQKIADFLSTVEQKIEAQKVIVADYEELKKGTMQKIFNQEVRFKDDDGNEFPKWRKTTIGEEGYFYYGKSAPKWSVTEDALIPCIRYGELYTKHKTIVKEIKSFTNIEKEKLKFSKGTEVLVPRVGEDPLDFCKCCYLPFGNVAIGEMISVYNTENDPLFISYLFNATMKYEFAKKVEGGAVSNLYFTYLEPIKINIPCLEEQKKIADCLSALDRKIEAEKKILADLEELKKGLLQGIFNN